MKPVSNGELRVVCPDSLCYSYAILQWPNYRPCNETIRQILKGTRHNMRFSQLDRILELDKGASIKAVKCLSLSEEYLNDHFPRFPVMPGVLMLESMFQASMWLVRETNDFKHSTVVLREAKSMKFQGFVQPGSLLVVHAEIKKVEDSITKLKVIGTIDGDEKASVSGRLTIESYNLADREGRDKAVDEYMIHQFRKFYRRLWAPGPRATA